MTQMLASVVDSQEAEMVIRAGADIIDLKNPHNGALGALPIEQIHAIVEQVAQRSPVSATIGDLPPDPQRVTKAVSKVACTGVNYVKVGFFSNENLDSCLQSIARITGTQAVIAVLFADRQPDLKRLSAFVDAGFQGIMLDTADKQQGHLLTHIEWAELVRFVEETRDLGLLSGLAGSLRLRDIPRLLPLAPDYLGFRGALCEHSDRVERINPRQVLSIRSAIPFQPVIRSSDEPLPAHTG